MTQTLDSSCRVLSISPQAKSGWWKFFHFASGEKIVRKALSTVLLVIAAFVAVTVGPAEAAGTHPAAGTVVSAAGVADIPLCC
ncbi:hypothetical protein AB0F71_27860 [Kitasatospora sp. NPDC028055]|uniref:hypothetical protein n=1 Tax=Kitasatospora sp. NPDC028055 TaxID=3155653 RepID=UPI003402C490